MIEKINNTSSINFPSFKNPPIEEVVCGLRFNTPDKLRIPHIGILWDKFRIQYPKIQHAPPVTFSSQEIQIDIESSLPLPRVWFINDSDDQLIQFQIDRFYFNWRRRTNNYPRYSYVISEFEKTLSVIMEFFDEFQFGEFIPIECELSYINQIPKGSIWEKTNDFTKIFSDFLWKQKTNRFLPQPENISWKTHFILPQNGSDLYVSLKQALRKEDRNPAIIFDMAVRGRIDTNDKKTIREWFDTAHESIVKSFVDLTTEEIRRTIWEQE